MDFKELEKKLGIEDENEVDFDEINRELDDLMSILDSTDEDSIIKLDQEYTDDEESSEEDIEQKLQEIENIQNLIDEDKGLEIEEIEEIDVMNDVSIYSEEDEENPKENTQTEKPELQEVEQEVELEEIDFDEVELKEIDFDEVSLEQEELKNLQTDNIDSTNSQEDDNNINKGVTLGELEKNPELKAVEKENFPKEKDKKPKKERKKINWKEIPKSSIIIYSSIAVLLLLIIVSTTFFAITIDKVKKDNLKKEIEAEREIVKATAIPEEKNAAYINVAGILDGIPITIEKVLVDPFYIKFILNTDINPIAYDIQLTDRAGNLYAMDVNFIKKNNGQVEFKFFNSDDLKPEYTLKFKNISTGEKTEFNFSLPKIDIDTSVKYLNNLFENNIDNFKFSITSGRFSATSSSINYKIKADKELPYEIQQGNIDNNIEYIRLYEESKEVQPIKRKPLITKLQDGSIIGSIQFDPLKNLDSNLLLSFKELYKKYNINKTISLSEINGSTKNGGVLFNFDKYNLFLESMPKFDNLYVLAFHGEDTTISTENKPKDFNRKEFLLDAELIVETPSGAEVIIKPKEATSAYYGTDMIFEIDEQQLAFVNGVSTNNIKLNVKSALMKLDDLNISVNLKRALDRTILEDEILMGQIKNAFLNRLKNNYKLNKAIKGFAESVTNDEKLSKEYTEIPLNNAKFSVNIISKSLEEDKLKAIVQESIKFDRDGSEVVTYKTHVIEADNIDNNWLITNDTILR